jgi:two-component system NtrC family sensor kinase
VIVLSEAGSESDIIQAFRLGAADYLFWPAGEAEMISVLERVLQGVRAKRERETLSHQLNQTNQELQRRVRELTTIFALGKAVTSITNQAALLDKIVEGAVYVSEADYGWLLLRQEQGRSFTLSAQRNLPETLASQINKPWDDGISSLVGVSGESLSVHGEPLKRFKISRLGQSILIVPIKVKGEIFGLLVVLRKPLRPFSSSSQALMEAVADYASISLVNARLFHVLEARVRAFHQAAEAAQARERAKDESLKKIRQELKVPLSEAGQVVVSLLNSDHEQLNPVMVNQLRSAHEKLRRALQGLETLENQK